MLVLSSEVTDACLHCDGNHSETIRIIGIEIKSIISFINLMDILIITVNSIAFFNIRFKIFLKWTILWTNYIQALTATEATDYSLWKATKKNKLSDKFCIKVLL